MARAAIVDQATEDYFDEIGPGDFFDIEQDNRGGRCVRFPETGDEFPARAGATLATRIIEALGGSSADGILQSISLAEPSYPTDLLD